MAGWLRDHEIGIRNADPRYSAKHGVSPNWDSTPTALPFEGKFDWQRWETAVYLNFC